MIFTQKSQGNRGIKKPTYKNMTLAHQKANKEITEINFKIELFEKELGFLYKNRAGKILWNNGDDAEMAWCAVCGKNTVHPNNGDDSCFECIEGKSCGVS